ncbi:hypothetical protein Tsubulata_001681 [Turnera subulata]|uniref:RING-type domain-containing protein n=1 Tax=Turnera subulata TaxID=218843 RepID=A0A9Q0FLL0_9ROSI|nr:hypothetical protein Tsubulata_001681 [Turnera subulata]
MGQQQSKEELLYQQVSYGNADGIKSLRSEGAGLEWIDKEGKTPLILACLNPELFNVAKTLIELGANVNAYRPGRTGGTPLHHAAKRGLDKTVKLLLSHGANPLMLNDDCQTPLEVARAKGYGNVVRTIENHICLFSAWMREFYGPGFLEVLAPQLVSRNVWVVILPTGSRDPSKPFKLELAIYPSMQDAKPRTVVALWRANLEEPKFHLSDASVTIVDNTKARYRLAPANEGDKQQLQWFCDACKGIPQATHLPAFLHNSQTLTVQATAPPPAEDLELEMAINASIQSAMAESQAFGSHPSAGSIASTSWNNSVNSGHQGALNETVKPQTSTSDKGKVSEAGPSSHSAHQFQIQGCNIPATQTENQASIPSAPPILNEVVDDGPIHYPPIDSSPIDLSSSAVETSTPGMDEKKEDGRSSSCVICLDAPVEGACIPCGHMAGCMSCLNEIKSKKWGCPVCRAKIDQIIRLYAV